MIKKGWIESSGSMSENTEALLSFFGMSNPEVNEFAVKWTLYFFGS